jgi:hypothetical protein
MISAFGVEHPEVVSKKMKPKEKHNAASVLSSTGAYGTALYGLHQADNYQNEKPSYKKIKHVHDAVNNARANSGAELKEMHVDAARDWHDKLGPSNLKEHIRNIKAGEKKLASANKLHAHTAPAYAKSSKIMRTAKLKGIGAGVATAGLAANAIEQGLKSNRAGRRKKP